MSNFNNLLIITNNFTSSNDEYIGDIFVKEQLKYIKNFFNNIYVICPVPYGLEILRKTKHVDYNFDNVQIFYPKYVNFPLFYFYFRKFWIDLENKAILNFINRNHLNFDIIHAHYTWPCGAVASELKRILKIPLVITEHTSISLNKAIREKDPIWIKAWQDSDEIIRVTSHDISNFEQVGINLLKIHYIPNGYNSKTFHPLDKISCRQKLGLPLDKKILLNVALLYSEVKGHKYFIESIAKIIKFRKDILAVIVGSGKLESTIKKQIENLGIQEYVLLVGGKPHHEIPLWMNACDLFVLPSLNEGNPTVLFECLGCGKPFVGTKVGGVPNVIISEEYGLLVEPCNPKDLSEKILKALNKDWDQEIILAYAEQYSWENVAKKIIDIYKQIGE